MSMRRSLEVAGSSAALVAASSAAVVAITAANRSSVTAETDPAVTSPNNTLEQVSDALGYGNVLGNLALRQHFSFDLPNGQRVNVYNLTPTKVGEATTERTAEAIYQQASSERKPLHVTLYRGSNAHRPYGAAVSAHQRQTQEHDILLIPDHAAMPDIISRNDMDSSTLQGVTRFVSDEQAISIVRQPTEGDYPTDWMNDSILPTELCQSEIEVTAATSADTPTTTLGQETYCNSIGEELYWASRGALYGTYQSFQRSAGVVSVEHDGQLEYRFVKNYTVPETAFRMAQTVLHASVNHPVN